MNIDRIFELDKRALEDVGQYQKKRFVHDHLAAGGGRPFGACFGPRGVGKNVLLRQLRAAEENGLYISADTLEPGDSLREVIVSFINTMKIENVFIAGINYSSVPENIGITKYKAEKYLRILEKTFFLSPVCPR